MKNKHIFILLFSLLSIPNCIFAQLKTMYSYNGNGGDAGIYFWYDMVITYNRNITGQYTIVPTTGINKGIYCSNIKQDAIISNTISNVNRSIHPTSTSVTVTAAYDTPVDDYYQNNIFFSVAPGYNRNTVNIPINYDNMSTSVNFTNAVYSGAFPVSPSSLPFYVLKYLAATEYVESNNTSIKNTAQSITSGCTNFREAIIKLCQWIEANIKMQDNNPPTKSSQVFLYKIADCDGAAHLLAAFCRSLNIPARIVSGYVIQHGIPYPINSGGTTITFGSGSGTTLSPHTLCEIYVPYMNDWVRCDPAQRTVFFGHQNFIKMTTELETIGLKYGYDITVSHPSPIPNITSIALNPSVFISATAANYQFVDSKIFMGTTHTGNNNMLLCAADPSFTVGFYDKVEIKNPAVGSYFAPNTYIITPCSTANFYAEFTTGSTPPTDADGYNWSIILYRSDGTEYVYAQQYHPISFNSDYWHFTAGTLPAYDWLYDPAGNIYGKVRVSVNISDGDIKVDETDIGVVPNNNIHNVIYSTDTTINSCSDVNIHNIQIQGTPTIIFNMNGHNITIDNTFEMPIGASFIINP